jgi:branched-chain amino acid transport system permease protein
MDRFFEYVFIGLSNGSIYALVALGLVVIFRGTGHLNFAQGEMATLSTFVVWWLADDARGLGIPLALATILGMVFGFAVGVTAEATIIRPLSHRSLLAVFVATIALFLGINAFNTGVWGQLPDEIIGNLFPSDPTDFVSLLGTTWRYEYIGIFVTLLVVTALLFLLFQKTKFGLAMRATASNTDSARLVGVRTTVVLAGSWGIAGALGALAGTLYAGIQGQVNPLLMVSVFVYAVAAATLGGLDSPGGAVIAGLLIGIFENLAAGYFPEWIGQEMKLVVALLSIFVVLLVKPSGLFGTAKIERV